jgi:sulfoxide reductase heme-binding subunit YedZ
MQAPRRGALQAIAVGAVALPALYLAFAALSDDLGANPIERVTHLTGDWALRLLLLSLAVTPARRRLGWAWAAPLRRTLGLAAFGYACLHYLTYLGLDHAFEWRLITEDVLERRYVTAGFAAFLCLVPLAITSTRAMIRRLGRRWNSLHRLAYLAALLAVTHFLWLVKSDLREPLAYATLLALLLGERIAAARKRRPRASTVEAPER